MRKAHHEQGEAAATRLVDAIRHEVFIHLSSHLPGGQVLPLALGAQPRQLLVRCNPAAGLGSACARYGRMHSSNLAGTITAPPL